MLTELLMHAMQWDALWTVWISESVNSSCGMTVPFRLAGLCRSRLRNPIRLLD
jgi:hypothetical protein